MSPDLATIAHPSFVDIPGQQPAVSLPLQAGSCHRDHDVAIIDPFTGRERDMLCTIEVAFPLPASQRGLHMSRMEDALHEVATPLSLDGYAKALAEACARLQGSPSCRVRVEGRLERTLLTPVSKRPTHQFLRVWAEASVGERSGTRIGMSAPFFNACPCAQRHAMREFADALDKRRLPLDILGLAPLQSHTNRGDLRIETAGVTFADLASILGAASPSPTELLKGEDEHALVKAAQARGMFVEDIVREAALQALLLLRGKVPPATPLLIAAHAEESVHVHHLFADITTTVGELQRQLQDRPIDYNNVILPLPPPGTR
ncbi:MAG: GTP cyclohydrolase I FolE2 [Candidatus Aenigmarchaeota archaeon]|nr:GTP cyclohydrolase I FolE2 [Candidatus Aenigmarchaeota archaeon]